MCGLLGASSDSPLNLDKIKVLYLLNKERGDHACGFSDGKTTIKDVVEPEEFITKVFENGAVEDGKSELKFNPNFNQFIGHTRYATVGDRKNAENAHPFRFKGKLIGTHNGTIRNIDELQDAFGTDFKVDSKFIYYLLSNYKLDRITPLLQGSLALAYHDLRTGTMKLYRFERPLYYGYTGENTIWYSSLKTYLEAIDCYDIKELPEHTEMTINNGQILRSRNLKKKLKPTLQTKKTPTLVTLDLKSKKSELRRLKNEAVNKWLEEQEKTPPPNLKSREKKIGFDTKVKDAKLFEDVPQTAEFIVVNDTPYYWWFDQDEYQKLYVKKFKEATEFFDMETLTSNKILEEDFGEIYEEIQNTFVDIKERIELRMQYEMG